jgi:hypothetical protein
VGKVSRISNSASIHLGFLSIQANAGSYVGGYLVINGWGRPEEFRVSSPVQPNHIHKILYSGTLLPYLCADLIGKTLIEKTTTRAQFILTDHSAGLELRYHFDIPVAWLALAGTKNRDSDPAAAVAPSQREGLEAADEAGPNPTLWKSALMRNGLICHPQFPQDAESFQRLMAGLKNTDLAEPFTRVREAIAEAQKLATTSRESGAGSRAAPGRYVNS